MPLRGREWREGERPSSVQSLTSRPDTVSAPPFTPILAFLPLNLSPPIKIFRPHVHFPSSVKPQKTQAALVQPLFAFQTWWGELSERAVPTASAAPTACPPCQETISWGRQCSLCPAAPGNMGGPSISSARAGCPCSQRSARRKETRRFCRRLPKHPTQTFPGAEAPPTNAPSTIPPCLRTPFPPCFAPRPPPHPTQSLRQAPGYGILLPLNPP